MSFSFSGFNVQNYIGAPYPQPIQMAGRNGYAVKLALDFLSYGASATNRDIVVKADLAGGAGGNRNQLLDRIRSIYIDNTASALPLFVKFPDTDFTVTAQAYSIGWYPVFTNGFVVQVGCFGFTNTNISDAIIYITNLQVSAFTDSSLQSVLEQNLSSLVLATGSSLASITPVLSGQDYNNGNMTITGGGGSGATAHGLLDTWGRFTAVVVDNAGTGYTGVPNVTPTGGQTIPPAFNPNGTYAIGQRFVFSGTEWLWNGPVAIQLNAPAWNGANSYPPNFQVSYSGIIWRALQQTSFNIPPSTSNHEWQSLGSPTPGPGGFWVNSGTAAGTTATFSTLLTAAATLITTSSIGVPALGDQAENIISTLAGAGVFVNNLFGSPYGSGFIILTHIDVRALTASVGTTWVIENANGYRPFAFDVEAAGQLLSLQKMNMKLDATLTWRLNCTNFVAGMKCSHGFAWTNTQQ